MNLKIDLTRVNKESAESLNEKVNSMASFKKHKTSPLKLLIVESNSSRF